MKRIKTFYDDHKDEIVVGSVACAVTALILTRKVVRNKTITDVGLWMNNDKNEALVTITKKNGLNDVIKFKLMEG